ncbi:MAG: response regulator [Lewinellaceae bacterium]|nr:response regulator [Phaeodactylibacter sp.]MCB9040126.1 response regulator [Lewinellaceae bacterium]
MQKRRCIQLFAFIISGFLCFRGFGQPVGNNILALSPEDEAYQAGRYDFGSYLYAFVDSAGTRTIEEVAAPSFQPRFFRDSLGLARWFGSDLGPDAQYIWARLAINPQLGRSQEWLINISAAEVDLYIPIDSSRFTHLRSGSVLPFRERAFQGSYGLLPCLPLYLPAGDTLTLYFKLKGPGYPLRNDVAANFNQTLFRPEVYAEWSRRARFLDALIIGILLAVAIYHLIIFFYQRQYVSLFFSLFVLSVALLIMMFSGYSQEFFLSSYNLRNGIIFSPITYFLVYLFYYLFSRLYLKLPEILPALDKIWAGLVLLDLASGALVVKMALASGGLWNVDSGQFFTLVSARAIADLPLYLIPVAAAIAAWRKGNKAAGIYLVAILAFVLQSLANDVNAWFGILPLPQWVYGDIGPAIMVLLFAMGIARQLKTLQEEKSSAEQAELAERAEASRIRELDAFKSRFYTNITHQFRTPLTIILGMAGQIKEHPSAWLNQGTEMIRRNGRRLLQLVDQILTLSRIEAGQLPARFVQDDVIRYLKYIVESFHSSAEQKNIRLQFTPGREELVVDYEPGKLMDILSNLISNAIKFTQKGGVVQVTASVQTEPAETLIIQVKDNGPGIAPGDLPRIFDRFYQAPALSQPSPRGQEPAFSPWGDRGGPGGAEAGAGIGLSLAYELVRYLNGQITAESEPGKGAAFSFALPITRSAPVGHDYDWPDIREAVSAYISLPEDGRIPEEEAAGADQHTVLIVEDNADVVAYIRSVMNSRFHVVARHDGIEGLAKARALIPDIIISDIMMPGMDGLELCRQLKTDKRTSHIPIILLTAKADVTSRIEGLQAGADAYLAKPFNQTELQARIDNLIELRNRLQERYRDLSFLFQPKHALPEENIHPEDHFMRELHGIIEENLSDPNFSIIMLCGQIGMSRATLYKKFKALSNQSVADFIRRVRLHKARQLLETTTLNVTQVAIDVGFKNLSTFSRSFSEEFGVNPSEIKKGDKIC